MRGATGVYPVKCHTCDFNPRTPRGVRRGAYTHTVWFSPYFNPRAPCGARQGDHLGGTPLRTISIHAPRAGRDRQVLQCPDIVDGITIHAPRAGRDGGGSTQGIFPGGFQSTRPVRGATAAASACACVCKFQSTRPVRGATLFPFRCGPPPGHFNPRAPCGARQVAESMKDMDMVFQSTRPVRGATTATVNAYNLSAFQSTRPVRGATGSQPLGHRGVVQFQSTRPVRGATCSPALAG